MTAISANPAAKASDAQPIVVSGTSFALNGNNVSYRFHVDPASGDLVSDHFGSRVTEDPVVHPVRTGGPATLSHLRREFPEAGRADFRIPAVQIKQSGGYVISDFKYRSHSIQDGKPTLEGQPSTFGSEENVKTLIIHMYDDVSKVAADLSYSVFPKHDAIARSVKITNEGSGTIVFERLSTSFDLPHDEYEFLGLHGDWSRERSRIRRKVDFGVQGFGSNTGFSSHFHNPFLPVFPSTTTETHGDAYGMSLVYGGSFHAEVEKSSQGLTRALIGMHPSQLSWSLKQKESFTSPECVTVFSNTGIGGMSRQLHRLFRQHLIKSKYVNEERPVLLNSWEGLYFDFDDKKVYNLAQETAKLGAKLLIMDDGWFGVKYPRLKDNAGLGDWVPNPDRFPDGLRPFVDKVTDLKVANSDEKLRFGLWVEPEMVNPRSELYEKHPDWVLHAGNYPRTEARDQLILNLALPEVQDYIIDCVAGILESAPITYIKWDHNRATHESPSPDNHHRYILGMYRVFEALTSRFPDVLWEGCASGGGRFDPSQLQYFPQIWTSDNMDPVDRLHMQFGTSVVYPASTMGAHVATSPNHVTQRETPMSFRAHVAMMGGSFGFELDPDNIPNEDRAMIPGLIALAEKINPIVVRGDLWRLRLPEDSNYPAAMYISEDGAKAVLFAFQVRKMVVSQFPVLRLQGLDAGARYTLDGEGSYSGATLMNGGIQYKFAGDYDSKVVFIDRI